MTSAKRYSSNSVGAAVRAIMTLSLLSAAAATQAQTAPATAAEGALEEVVVTSERREQSLQTVPVAISALSGDTVEQLGISNANELQDFVPALTVRSTNIGSQEFSIRGIGSQTTDDVTTDSAVGFFIDDVFMARGGAKNSALFDVQRIEVLRGPQGTLYGRNTMAGAINVITNDPSENFEGRLMLETGDYNLFNAKGVVNMPLIKDRLFARVVLSSENRDGFHKNIVDLDAPQFAAMRADPRFLASDIVPGADGAEGDKLDTQSGRVKLKALLTDNIDVLFSYDQERVRPGAQMSGFFIRIPGTVFQYNVRSPLVPTPDDLRTSHVNNPGEQKLDSDGFGLKATFRMNFANLILIGASRKSDVYFFEDLDQSYMDVAWQAHDEESKTRSFEARLVSNDDGAWSMGGKVQWTAGMYFFDEEAGKTIFNRGRLNPYSRSQSQAIDTNALGIFAQTSIDIADKLSLTLGLRYTDEEKDVVLNSATDPGFNLTEAQCLARVANGEDPAVFQPNGRPLCFHPNLVDTLTDFRTGGSWDDFSGKIALQYQATDNAMAYLSFSQGFNSGGFNGQPGSLQEAAVSFAPEHVNTYELGTKFESSDRVFRANLALFYNDYKDIQQAVFLPQGGLLTANAKSAETFGFEAEISALLWDRLTLSADFTKISAKFLQFQQPDGAGGFINQAGEDIIRVPSGRLHTAAVYRFPASSIGSFSLRADMVFEGGSINQNLIANGGGDRIKGWQKADAQLGYSSPDDKWGASLWVRNITDELYYTRSSLNFIDPEGVIPAFWQEPRTYGASVSYKF